MFIYIIYIIPSNKYKWANCDLIVVEESQAGSVAQSY